MSKLATQFRMTVILTLIIAVSACTTSVQSTSEALRRTATWAVATPDNLSGALNADLIFQQLLGTSLAKRAIAARPYRGVVKAWDNQSLASMVGWARSNGIDYVVASSIGEWRYRGNGVGGPSVGVTLTVIRVADQQVLWQTSAARSDWSGRALEGTAIKVAEHVVDGIKIERH